MFPLFPSSQTLPCQPDAISLFCPAVSKQTPTRFILENPCAGPLVCPLSQIKAGSLVCIKQLSGSPEISARLREMGLGEKQMVKLLSRHSSIICQVCNARLGISKKLAESILVERVHPKSEAA